MSLYDQLRRHAAERGTCAAILAPGREPITFAALDELTRDPAITAGSVVPLAMPDGPDFIVTLLRIMRVAVCAPLNPASPEPSPAAGVDAALLLHTSATTARAKRVPITHANLQAMLDNTIRTMRLSPADRLLSLMPLFHLQGLAAVLAQLYVGGSVIATSGFDAAHIIGWLEVYRPTWYTGGPVLHRALLTALERHGRAFDGSLRFIRSIGAPLPPSLLAELESALHAPVLEGYGLTEAGLVTSNPLPPLPRKPGSVGISAGPEIRLVDGEVLLRGPAVIGGYHDDAAANAEAFREGWFRTGDLGRFDEDGYLYITGRLKEIVNRGGEKIIPQEVDAALAAHPAVADVAAFGVPHPTVTEDVAALVVLRPGATATESELREFAAQRLAAFKIPRRILFAGAIPKSATGKPQRTLLARQVVANTAHDADSRLAAIWRRILRRDHIPAGADFFEAGGDSLSATVMLLDVEAEFGLRAELSATEFFASPTLETLETMVAAVRRNGATTTAQPASRVLALQRRGTGTPLFFVAGADEDASSFRHIAAALGDRHPFYALKSPPDEDTLEAIAAAHIALIRPLHTSGPFILGGHCFGGIVAFEMARQLVAAGGEVPFVAMIDTPVPVVPRAGRHWRGYARELASGRVGVRELSGHVRFLLERKRRQASPVPAAIDSIPQRNEAISRRYRPAATGVRVINFIAAEHVVQARVLEDPRLAWKRYATAGFETRSLPAGHHTILLHPHAGEIARELASLLTSQPSSLSPTLR